MLENIFSVNWFYPYSMCVQSVWQRQKNQKISRHLLSNAFQLYRNQASFEKSVTFARCCHVLDVTSRLVFVTSLVRSMFQSP